jgi:uncharacterized membrane protein
MGYLQLGLALFAAPHLFSLLMPQARSGLRARMGEGQFKGLYSLVSLAGLALMIWGYGIARADPASGLAYETWAAGRHVTMLLVLVAFILIAASHGKGHIKRWVRQPMSIAIALWAIGHLLVNGAVPDVWLFGGFLVISMLDIILSEARGKAPRHEPKIRSDIIAIVAGVVLYGVFVVWLHPWLIGVPVLA